MSGSPLSFLFTLVLLRRRALTLSGDVCTD
jgi:hypothetical protein